MSAGPGPPPARLDLRSRIEAAFEAWARTAHRRPRTVLALALAATLPLAAQLPSLEVDNSSDSFLRPDDPIRLEYDAFRAQFGLDTRISLAIEGEEIFSLPFLERLRALHRAVLEEVPHLDEVTSLVNARDTHGVGDTLVVGELMEEWPESAADLERLRERALANPLYRNTLLAPDGGLTTLSITLSAFTEAEDFDPLAGFDDPPAGGRRGQPLTGEQEESAVRAARALQERFDAPGFRISLAGSPVLTETLNRVMVRDIQLFLGICLATIAGFLGLLFRRLAAVVLPIGIVVLSLVASFGVVAATGGAIGFGTQILPSFLMAVGVCDAVHILAIYSLGRRAGRGEEDAVAHAMRHSALAILMTSLTTAGGLASFVTGELAPIADIGLYAPVGVLLAFVYTVLLMPAALALLPMGAVQRSSAVPSRLDRALRGTGAWSARHRGAVLLVSLALAAAALAGTSFLRLSHDPMDWFPEREPLLRAMRLANERLGGVNSLEVVFAPGYDDALKEPANLERLEGFEVWADRYGNGPLRVGQTLSILDVLRETNRALHANDAAFYRVPREADLVAQELLLFEGSGSDDLEELVDTRYSQARVSLRVPWVDALHYPRVIEEIEAEAKRRVGSGVRVVTTGLVAMLSRTFLSMIHSMLSSYALALLVIAPLMMLLLGSVRLGLISLLPNLLPIALLVGGMGWAGLPIDGLSLMTGAIVLGLAIDDTIHFMHNFRRGYRAHGDALRAIDETLATAGRALLVTSLVLAAGFSTFAGAYASNVKLFGLLTAGTILVAFVSNVVLGSALVSYASAWGITAGRRPGGGVGW